MTSPQDLDQVTNKKLDKIARLQHVHGKRLDDLRDGNLLDEIVKLLRKEQ